MCTPGRSRGHCVRPICSRGTHIARLHPAALARLARGGFGCSCRLSGVFLCMKSPIQQLEGACHNNIRVTSMRPICFIDTASQVRTSARIPRFACGTPVTAMAFADPRTFAPCALSANNYLPWHATSPCASGSLWGKTASTARLDAYISRL